MTKLFASLVSSWLCVSLITDRLAKGDRSDLWRSKSSLWIEDEDFAVITKLSFPYSKCCNVFLSRTVEFSAGVLNQFRDAYPYEYVLGRIDQECDGYLLFGSNATHIVETANQWPVLLWKTEILIIVNDYIPSDSTLLNALLYGFASVNIVSRSGSWKLSENYLKPRTFTKLARYEEMRHEESANLRGREIQACSFYRPPMSYLNRTTHKMIDDEPVEVFLMDSPSDWDGVEMKLFLIMADKLNFTWTIRKPEGKYTYGLRVNNTVWKGGMIEMVHEEKVDIAFANIWVTLDQSVFAHLTEPWFQADIHFLVPRPSRTTDFWAVCKPFPEKVWFLVMGVLFSYSLYTYVRAWVDPKFPKEFRNFHITLIDLIGCLLSTSIPRSLAANQLQTVLWRTAGWLLITAYSSSLASRLTRNEYENRIDTVEQFIEANLTWGSTEIPPFNDYFDLTDPYSSQIPDRYILVDNAKQLEALIARGNYAILGKIIDKYFYPDDLVPNETLKKYRLMKQSLGRFHVAFAVQPWLLKHVNQIMLLLRQTGITIWHLHEVLRSRNTYNLREVLVEYDGHDGTLRVLKLRPLGAGFCLLLLGSLIAAFVFYAELKRASGSTGSIRELFRAIHRNRGTGRESS